MMRNLSNLRSFLQIRYQILIHVTNVTKKFKPKVILLGRFLATNFIFEWLPFFMNMLIQFCNHMIFLQFPILNGNLLQWTFFIYLFTQVIVLPEFILKCEICDIIFARKFEFRKHIKIAHEGNLSNLTFAMKKRIQKA